MEDAHAAVLDLQAKYTDLDRNSSSSSSSHGAGGPTPADKRLSFFGVYDGHGGEQMALYAGENVHRIVARQESFARGDIEQALRDGFLATDRAILEGLSFSFTLTHTLSLSPYYFTWYADAL